jgi:hypothetical protein
MGAILALAVGGMAGGVGFDRDRAFYPAITAVVASYYVLFAVLGGSGRALFAEAAVATAFLAWLLMRRADRVHARPHTP